MARKIRQIASLSPVMLGYRRSIILVVLMQLCLLLTADDLVSAADYQGALLGKLNSYAHQVNGDVYIIDEHSFLIRNFFYDGLSQDAFFWAGSSIRPSNKGFIVPSEDGRTNRLQRYTNRDITIRLPDERRVSSIRWLSVWDIRASKNLGDIVIPEGFEAPTPKKISEFSQLAHGVKSDTVTLINSKAIGIERLFYDGISANAYFYAGIGPQPNVAGYKIPDEVGSLEALGSYEGENIVLELPGNLTVFDIDWLSIYDPIEQENFGSVLIPSHLNVPPALVTLIKHESRLPQCEQLHRDLQLNWEVFGPQITFELVARADTNDYIAFGLSGSDNSSRMIGADVALSYLSGHLGYTFDYNITDKHPCVQVPRHETRGVCPDTRLPGGVDNYQIHSYSRENGLTKITFRRNLLNTGDEGDKNFKTQGASYIVWAVGRLNKFKEPRYHHLYTRGDSKIEFGRKISKNCFQFVVPQTDYRLGQAVATRNNFNDVSFKRQQAASLNLASPIGQATSGSESMLSANGNNAGGEGSTTALSPFINSLSWGQPEILNKSATTFYARLGHPGVHKGYMHISGEASPGLVWYINGLMAPILHVQRGRTYTFRLEAGRSPELGYRFYHPFYITDEPYGGYLHQNATQRQQQKILAGLEFEPLQSEGAKLKERLASKPEANGREKPRSSSRSAESQSSASSNNAARPHVGQLVQMFAKPLTDSMGQACTWLPKSNNDIRRAEQHHSFAQFRAKLDYHCEAGADKHEMGIVVWTPNMSTPDVVYYQSYTQRNMGWKILVRDEDDENLYE